MARINYKELRRQYDAKGAEATVTFLRECFATKQMSPSDFSIAELFEDVVPDGREAIRLFDPKHADGYTVLREAGAVNTAAFSNITGQLAYSAVLEGYMAPELVFTKATKHISTRLSGEIETKTTTSLDAVVLCLTPLQNSFNRNRLIEDENIPFSKQRSCHEQRSYQRADKAHVWKKSCR